MLSDYYIAFSNFTAHDQWSYISDKYTVMKAIFKYFFFLLECIKPAVCHATKFRQELEVSVASAGTLIDLMF
jgi:hypothetical protein